MSLSHLARCRFIRFQKYSVGLLFYHYENRVIPKSVSILFFKFLILLSIFLNSAFKRFVLFTREFKLLSKRDYAPLQDLIDKKLDSKGLKKGHYTKNKPDSVGVPKYMLSAKQPIVSPLPKNSSKPVEAPTPPTEEEEEEEKSGGRCLVM